MINFREVKLEDAKLILDWRTSERVTKFMNSDMQYDLEAQKRWLSGVYSNENYYPWIIQWGEKDVGLIYLEGFNRSTKDTSWGFYIGEESVLGIGGMVPPYFYNFAFYTLGVETINAEVFFDNLTTIRLHLAQGYSFNPMKDHVIKKNGKNILIVCMTLTNENFKSSRYARLKKDLPMSKWEHKPFSG